MSRINILKATKQKLNNKRIFGFDIETYDNNKKFLMASIIGENYKQVFYDKDHLIRTLKGDPIFKNSIIFATNLGFDFFGTFFKDDESKNFYTLFRGSDLLLAKTYFYKGEFVPTPKLKTKSLKSLLFLDSMNFAKISVSKMGEIIGLSKIESPSFLGKYPSTDKEWDIMREYNIRDSMITYEFMKFIIETFESMGGTFKNTLASTSMSLFKNKYLKGVFFQPDKDLLLEEFESYYGGRTEAFKRGTIKDYNYYDFNSLYPSVMRDDEFPDPNTLRISRENTVEYINNFHGCSLVDIYVFPCKYPVLPYRKDNGRVVFPVGNIKGWYTHIELREAVKQGSVIKKVYKTHYFKKTCRPFKDFMEDLYNLRQKNKNTPMEYVIKITMNSLYGKFGQRWLDKDNWIHESSIRFDDISKLDFIEFRGRYARIKKNYEYPSSFCIPIWASYVTAYGRLKLHKAILETDPVYCDTDSLLTEKSIRTSTNLGDLKLEMHVKEGIIVRPKFYALIDKNDEDHIKIKGLGKRLSFAEFVGLMHIKNIKYDKFAKFKESLRRDLIPNEIIEVTKEFSLEDEKRLWQNYEFDYEKLEDSMPLIMGEEKS